ncbi:MAG: hypothetical protein LC798_04475 [Chloroflexi bacterium]|nr:hypothetical protein [Chloroflexota bacterium]
MATAKPAGPDTGDQSQGAGSSAHVVKTRLVRDTSGGELPIIEFEARAPDAAGATRLIHAVIDGLNEYLDQAADQQQVDNARRLQVSTLNIAPTRTERRGPGLSVAVIVGLLTLLGGCGAIIVVGRGSRMLRDAGERAAPPTTSQAPPTDVPTLAVAPRAVQHEAAATLEQAQDERSPAPKAGRAWRQR